MDIPMPILSNQRWERFAQSLASGRTADGAYVDAGYARNDGNAIRLKSNPTVATRIIELQGVAAKEAVLTKTWIIERLVENVERAMTAVQVIKAGKPTGTYTYGGAVANRSLELLGKELGMFVD